MRALRRRALLTQEELADISQLSVGTIRGLETGRIRQPHTGTLRKLTDALTLSNEEARALAVTSRVLPTRIVTKPDTGPVPAQLPASIPSFVGRTEPMWRLDTHLTPGDGATVTQAIVGSAGIGKTTLAVHWAHRVRRQFPDGQIHLNLRGFDPHQSPLTTCAALHNLLAALHCPPHLVPANPDAQVGLYRSLMAGRRMLILLDNARDAQQVRPLLPGSAGSLVLVTSRDRLSGLVTADGAGLLTLPRMPLVEARELLARRLGVQRAAADHWALDEIIEHCDRLPLALASAATFANRHPEASLGHLAAQLRNPHQRLDILSGSDPATNIRSVFSWSYTTLSPEAARLFRLLTRHREEEITAKKAAALALLSPAEAHQLLSELARLHLIEDRGPDRYVLHGLLRAYGEELTYPALRAS
ncbi:helix-turn-helix transcriptional regulator [Micromonospora sp. NPDC048170]|uniref:helix-turn-helix transcriptional regulator n=1 Tax=Micromonospora sp. NPDC048170 TaxID=3154819 RepID=UPI0033CAF2CF